MLILSDLFLGISVCHTKNDNYISRCIAATYLVLISIIYNTKFNRT